MSESVVRVIRNARIWSAGRQHGFASTIAMKEDRILAVGDEGIIPVGVPREDYDAEGRTVIPGLIDAHVHMLDGGLGLSRLDLRGARSKHEFIDAVAAYAESLEPDAWLVGMNWASEDWSEPAMPQRDWIDSAAGGRPALLFRADLHSAVANSEALSLSRIDENGPADPAGGVIDRDCEGRPTGMLRESAIGLVADQMPPCSDEQRIAVIQAAMVRANSFGITSVADIPMLAELYLYQLLARRGSLTARFFVYPVVSDLRQELAEVNSFEGRRSWVEVAGIKQFMDGSLGSRTAYMRDPYLHADVGGAGWRGVLTAEAEDGRLERNLAIAHEAGIQTMTHAIGDEAVHMLINMIVRSIPLTRQARPRCEHAQHLLSEDLARFAELGIVASMQPRHKTDDGGIVARFLGNDRATLTYDFGTLIESGACVPFGSDWPVAELNPFTGVEAAVEGTWDPEQNVTVEQALEAYTASAAYAMFAENEIGRLEEGMKADLVVLTDSPFDRDPEWGRIRPERLVVDGKPVI